MENKFIVLLVFIFTSFGIAAGFGIGKTSGNENMLNQCAKQHNVYQCVLVAVPKEVGG